MVMCIRRNANGLQLLSQVCMRTLDTVAKRPIPPLTLCCHVTLKHDRVTTLYTLWTTPSVTVVKLSSVHAHGVVTRGRNFKHFKTSVGRARYWMLSPLFHHFAYEPWTVLEGQGRFPPTPITADYTTCNVRYYYRRELESGRDTNAPVETNLSKV